VIGISVFNRVFICVAWTMPAVFAVSLGRNRYCVRALWAPRLRLVKSVNVFALR
jgi:hypothetical protein